MQAVQAGAEFRDDKRLPGTGNAAARRLLTPAELAPLTHLSAARSLLAIAQSVGLIAAAVALGIWAWPNPWVLAGCVMVLGVAQHGLFILSHEAAHYRLLPNRALNDLLGTWIGMSGGVSMHTYRVTHRLHHNNLYGPLDPDTAIHGGYPRGRAYLCRKLALDLVGWNAWKTYAYFFGSPAINEETGTKLDVLNDTSPELRRAARADRWRVVAFHLVAPIVAWGLGASLGQGLQGLAMYLVLWLLPLLTVLQPILRLRAICEHGATTDFSSPLTAARSNRTTGSFGNLLGRLLLFPHHVNYHLEHHLYPAVPHYHLPALHRLLVRKGAIGPGSGAEVRDLTDTLALVFAPKRATGLQPIGRNTASSS
jgi:fatty acid desaturase